MRIHAVPQFQGALVESRSGLPSGCRALAGLAGRLFGVDVTEIPVSTDTSPTISGIANLDVLLEHQEAQRAALSSVDGPVLTIGGDCSVDLVPVRRLGDDVTVLWFDAHADLNTPASSPSGAFHGMVLRSAMGAREVVLVGARSIDDGEWPLIGEGKRVTLVERGELAPRNRDVYLHVDLDVLSPDEFTGMTYPEPDGLGIDELADQVRRLSPQWRVVGAAITECVTNDEAELAKLIPLLEAVGEVLTYRGR